MRALLLPVLLLVGCVSSPPPELAGAFPGAFGVLRPQELVFAGSSQLGGAPLPDLPWLAPLQRARAQILLARRERVRGRPGRAINRLRALAEEVARTPALRIVAGELELEINAELARCREGPLPLERELVELAEPIRLPRLGGVAAPVKQVAGP